MALLFRDFFNQIDEDYVREKYEELKGRFYMYGARPSEFLGTGENQEIDMFAEKFIEMPQGCAIKWEGHKYPMRAYIHRPYVITLTQFKRILPLFFRFLKGSDEFDKNNILQKLIIVIGLTQYWKFLLTWMHWGMRDIYLPRNKYNQPSHELYGAITNEKVRDILCVVFEYDCAYKYRLQDISTEIKKGEFIPQTFFQRIKRYVSGRHSAPVQELSRLMDIMISREQTGFMERGSDGKKGGVAKTFVLKKLILFYLEFNHKLLREICLTVYRIDFDKIKPSIDDKYWMCSPAYSKSYKFMGLADEERAKLREKL